MKNRYGDEITFEKQGENLYELKTDSNMMHCRFGARPGSNRVDVTDLEYVDPSGGPFISVGHYSIDGRLVKRISSVNGQIFLEVE